MATLFLNDIAETTLPTMSFADIYLWVGAIVIVATFASLLFLGYQAYNDFGELDISDAGSIDANEKPSGTYEIPMPKSLRDRLAGQAEKEGVNLDVFVVACLERHATAKKQQEIYREEAKQTVNQVSNAIETSANEAFKNMSGQIKELGESTESSYQSKLLRDLTADSEVHS